jgi:AcrR family transcriptional regulator
MPYPSQVNRDTILEQAVVLIKQEGVEALSLAKLATALGIKAPSLYRYYDSRTRLLQGVNLLTTGQLAAAMHDAAQGDDPYARLLAMARAYRRYALENPSLYMLAFSDLATPDADALLGLALPLQAAIETWVGAEGSLAALRGLFALAHGYASLEISGRFQRGGDLEVTYEQVVGAYLRGLVG